MKLKKFLYFFLNIKENTVVLLKKKKKKDDIKSRVTLLYRLCINTLPQKTTEGFFLFLIKNKYLKFASQFLKFYSNNSNFQGHVRGCSQKSKSILNPKSLVETLPALCLK